MPNSRCPKKAVFKAARLREGTAVRLILADERLYGDGPPRWFGGRRQRPCETAAQAKRNRSLERASRFRARAAASMQAPRPAVTVERLPARWTSQDSIEVTASMRCRCGRILSARNREGSPARGGTG